MPKENRQLGYFALPVLVDDQIVAAVDLKTDRQKRKLLMQQWSWVGDGTEAENTAQGMEAPYRGRARAVRGVSVRGSERTVTLQLS